MNIYTMEKTDRLIGDWMVKPASPWFQSINAMFIIFLGLRLQDIGQETQRENFHISSR